jgi:hypothetical protein
MAALVLLTLAPSEARADWEAQLSSRLMLGGGAYIAEVGQDPWPLFEMAIRADVLFGERLMEQVRFGPAVDLRTEGFRTFEAAGGLAVFFPTGRSFGLTLTAGAGWGARPEGRDGALAFANLALGYRPFNYFSVYGYALSIYAASRVQLEPDPRVWEVTVGVEVDFEFLFAIPFMLFYELANGGDPHEPEETPEVE